MNINELSKEYEFLENLIPSNEYELLEINNNYYLFLKNDGNYYIFNFSLGINKHPTTAFFHDNKEVVYTMFDLLSNSNPNRLVLTRDCVNSCFIAISLNEKPINKNSFVYYKYNSEFDIIERKEINRNDLQTRPIRNDNDTTKLRNSLLFILGVNASQYTNVNLNTFPIINNKSLASQGDIIQFSDNYDNQFYSGKVISCQFDNYKEDYLYTINNLDNDIHCYEKYITNVISKDNMLLEEIKEYYNYVKHNKNEMILEYFDFDNDLKIDI